MKRRESKNATHYEVAVKSKLGNLCDVSEEFPLSRKKSLEVRMLRYS